MIIRHVVSVRRGWILAGILVAVASVASSVSLRGQATSTAFQYNIHQIEISPPDAPPGYVKITYSVSNPQKTGAGAFYNLATDPAWTQTASGASRLFLQVAWDTRDFNNAGSGSNTVAGGRGAAQPIPVNALGTFKANGDGTYTVVSPLPVPLTATGTGEVAMEGHPAGQDSTGAYTVRIPVKSVYRYFAITDTSITPRRQVVDVAKCMGCHRPDGTGEAPRLTLHGNNRTEEPQVCVVCHNPNNTDIVYRKATDTKAVIAGYTFPEQSIDFKRLVHGIHASSAGFRNTPLIVIGFNGTPFDASTLVPYPEELKRCALCHVDDGRRATYELPLAPTVLGSTVDTKSFNADGTVTIDTDPNNDVKITPTAAVCSSCHDGKEAVSHMVRTGGASFSWTSGQPLRERCVTCHGPGKDKSVRKVHS